MVRESKTRAIATFCACSVVLGHISATKILIPAGRRTPWLWEPLEFPAAAANTAILSLYTSLEATALQHCTGVNFIQALGNFPFYSGELYTLWIVYKF